MYYETSIWDSGFVPGLLSVIAVMAIILLPYKCAVEQCADICHQNKDEEYYKVMYGCMCKSKEDGRVYNPFDERE